VATSHPPIPEPSAQLPRTSSYIDYSTLPYSQVYVHFPPSPTLTSTHIVDPPRLYDRSPIVVAENSCAMPQRGCPGRTYATVDGVGRGVPTVAPPPSNMSYPKYFIPSSPRSIPPLISDEPGSSSDDSDTLSNLPELALDRKSFCHPLCVPSQHSPLCRAHTRLAAREQPESTQFLPHPPVSPRTNKLFSVGPRKPSNGTRAPSTFVPTWDSADSCLEGF